MMRTGWLQRNRLRLAVHGGGKSGPALVFQHGLCGDARQVAEAMAGLAPQRWAGLECHGHGPSDLGPEISIARFAGDVAALIESLPGPVVLGGISMAAAVASRVAVMRSDLVARLRDQTALPIDVHLMVAGAVLPSQIDQFAGRCRPDQSACRKRQRRQRA